MYICSENSDVKGARESSRGARIKRKDRRGRDDSIRDYLHLAKWPGKSGNFNYQIYISFYFSRRLCGAVRFYSVVCDFVILYISCEMYKNRMSDNAEDLGM